MSKQKGEPKLFSVVQVAERAGLSKFTVLKAIESKQLPAEKVGFQYVITETAMNAWIANRRKPGRPKVT